jgi:biopolymer transport protein ExbD
MSEYTGGNFNYSGGSEPSDVAGARGVAGAADIRKRPAGTGGISRAKMAREARRTAQFAKFRLTELNLVPLVDTFVSIVFFALTTATVGELAPVVRGVTLPESRVGNPALQQITVGVGAQVTLAGQPVMSTRDAALAQSNVPGQPLAIPALLAALKVQADSVRAHAGTPGVPQVEAPLAIQGDRSMRYDLLSRVITTARLAGFKNISLQVNHAGGPGTEGTSPGTTPAAAPAAAPQAD